MLLVNAEKDGIITHNAQNAKNTSVYTYHDSILRRFSWFSFNSIFCKQHLPHVKLGLPSLR